MATTSPSAPTGAEHSEDAPALAAARVAFSLGWGMADLYEEGLPKPSEDPKPGPRLPGIGRLADAQRLLLRLDQVDAALALLAKQIAAADLPAPSTKALRAVSADPDRDGDRFKLAVYALHVELLRTLTAADFRLGKAYGLGRALANSCDPPADIAALSERFSRYRLDVLRTWLNDSASNLPAHSAKAVLLDFSRWEAWVANAKAAIPDKTAWEESAGAIRQTLCRQGEMWRAVLSGEKQAADMLTGEGYLQAARTLMRRGLEIARPILARYLLLLGLLVIAISLIALWVFSNGTTQLVAGAGTLATALGITWKTVGATAQHLGEAVERPLWNAELDAAVGEALLNLPLDPIEEPHPNVLLDTPLYLRALEIAQTPTAAGLAGVLAAGRGPGGRRLALRDRISARPRQQHWQATSPEDVRYWLTWAVAAGYAQCTDATGSDGPGEPHYSLTAAGARLSKLPRNDHGALRAELSAVRKAASAEHEPETDTAPRADRAPIQPCDPTAAQPADSAPAKRADPAPK
jgi:hypothetical protein